MKEKEHCFVFVECKQKMNTNQESKFTRENFNPGG